MKNTKSSHLVITHHISARSEGTPHFFLVQTQLSDIDSEQSDSSERWKETQEEETVHVTFY